MWGKDRENDVKIKYLRITPAYAGKSRYFFIAEKLDEGSPPPMRGKAKKIIVPLRRSGITPAYAGKSYSWKKYQDTFGDHPRLCGEKKN